MEPALLAQARQLQRQLACLHGHRKSHATGGSVTARSFDDSRRHPAASLFVEETCGRLPLSVSILRFNQLESRLPASSLVAGIYFVGLPPRPNAGSSSCRQDLRSTSS